MKEKTCCFTGHRDLPPSQLPRIARALETRVRELTRQGVIYFGSGGALGFDLLAAQIVLKIRETDPRVRLIMVYPCPQQTDRWREEDKALYEQIKSRADKIVYVSDHYWNGSCRPGTGIWWITAAGA